MHPSEIIEIIGKPMTLNKLILILKTNGEMVKKNNKWYILFSFKDTDIYWDLKKDTVKEQKKGTQKLINKLITKVNEINEDLKYLKNYINDDEMMQSHYYNKY